MSTDTPATAAHQSELEVLRQRVGDLEEQLREREAIEQMLRERIRQLEERAELAAILEGTPDFVGLATPEGQTLYLNPAGCAMFAITDGDATSYHVSQYVAERMLPLLGGVAIPTALREGRWSGENVLLRPDGVEVPVSQIILAHKGPDGTVHHLSTIIRDISEQKRIEQQLRESEQRIFQIMEALPVAIFVTDAQGHPIYANRASYTTAGKDAAANLAPQDLGAAYTAYRAGTDQLYPAEQLPLARALAGERSTVSDIEIRHADRVVPLEVMGAPIYDAEGQLVYAVAVSQDISERKKVEEALRRSILQEEVIIAQQATLAELSTPLLAISPGVVVMPLIGTVDSRRAQQMMETLLQGIAENHAHVVILDITGVSVVDTQMANVFVRAAQAVKLLGAEVVITGIRPEVAQTLVGLGVDLRNITTRGTLQSGIATALRKT